MVVNALTAALCAAVFLSGLAAAAAPPLPAPPATEARTLVATPLAPLPSASLPSAAAVAVAATGGTAAPPPPAAAGGHLADAGNSAAVAAGATLYRANCARCHGRRLEGQALWQVQDQYAHQRAPALDDTGHGWQHSDEELFQITRSGRLPGMPDDLVSRMPAASATLSDGQILQILAFIKARWTLGIRVSQATLNPDFAGMPADADSVAWKLPPNCSGSLQNWRQENRQ